MKRKLISNKQVSKLVPVFDSTSVLPEYSPGVCGISESPAKKQKLEHQGVNNLLANSKKNYFLIIFDQLYMVQTDLSFIVL